MPAPKQRNTEDGNAAIKAGKSVKEMPARGPGQVWLDQANWAAQKSTNARGTLKIGAKIRYRPEGTLLPQIAQPVFGYSEQERRASGAA